MPIFVTLARCTAEGARTIDSSRERYEKVAATFPANLMPAPAEEDPLPGETSPRRRMNDPMEGMER